VILEAQGEIELVGPSVVSLQGGMTGTYVRTTGNSGSGKLLVKAQGCDLIEIRFTV
jgi:beta-galactosidase